MPDASGRMLPCQILRIAHVQHLCFAGLRKERFRALVVVLPIIHHSGKEHAHENERELPGESGLCGS